MKREKERKKPVQRLKVGTFGIGHRKNLSDTQRVNWGEQYKRECCGARINSFQLVGGLIVGGGVGCDRTLFPDIKGSRWKVFEHLVEQSDRAESHFTQCEKARR